MLKNRRRIILLLYLAMLCLMLSSCAPGREETNGPPATTQNENVSHEEDTGSPANNQEENVADGRMTFLFFSDTQADPETGDYSAFGELLSLAVKREETPGLILFGGDTVNDGGDASEWRDFWDAASAPLSGLITAAAAGNHDNYPLLTEQFDYPTHAPAEQGGGYFYSFTEGIVHFLMLDSNIMGAAREAEIIWMTSDLQNKSAAQATWRVAVMHHPMWPVNANPKDEARAQTMREHFLPAMEAYAVDLILCGHQHVYARSLPMKGDAVSPDGKGITQVMAASGGKGSYTANITDFLELNGSAPNYLLIEADYESLNITAFNGENEPMDIFTILR